MGFAGQLFDKPGEGKYTQKYLRDLQKTSGSSSSVKEEVKGQNVEEKKDIDRPQKKDRTAGEINGVKQVMGYPIARGPRDSTGDALVIKAIEYIPPTTGLKATKAKGYYAKDGTDSGVPVKAGDVVGVFDKSGNRLGDKQFIGDVKLNNEGASDRQKIPKRFIILHYLYLKT